MNVSLYVWQRATAAVMAPMVVVHLVVMFYAARHGMTAADILGRTRGSFRWGAFYALFVVAASIHGSIGVRNVIAEWTALTDRGAAVTAAILGIALVALGMRAVVAVTVG